MTLTPNGWKMCAKLDRLDKSVIILSRRLVFQKNYIKILWLFLPFYICFFFSVLPRIMFDRFSESEYSHVLSYEHARDDIAELIVQVCRKYKFDGIVLEVYFQLAGRVQDKHLLRLVEHLGQFIHCRVVFYLLIFPPFSTVIIY